MADYLSPPPSLSSSPPLSPPLFSPSFHISSFLSLQNRHNFFCGSQGNGSKCRVQVIWKGRSEKKLAMPLPLLPYKHKKITAVLLATSYLSREPVQRLIDLAKNMCIYCIAVSVQHAYADLKIMLKICFLLWFPNSFFFPFGGGGGNFCFFLTLKRPNHFIGWGRRVSLLCRPCNFLVIASLLHQQGE